MTGAVDGLKWRERRMSKAVLRGRSDEIALALARLRHARSNGQGGVLLIEGPAGIGKSALAAEILTQAARFGFRCAAAKADQISHTTPAAPVLLALRSGPDPLLATDEVKTLTDLIATPLVLLEEVAGLLELGAAPGPVLIAIDDVQWIDPVSRMLLRALPDRLSGWPVVWVFAGRPMFEGLLADLDQRPLSEVPTEVIRLRPLAARDIAAIARDRLGHSPTDGTRKLLDGAGGSPFFAHQILDGAIQAPAADGDTPDIPTEFILGIRHRVAGLRPSAADLLRLLAVYGQPIGGDDAIALAQGCTPQSVVAGLAELEQANLLFTLGTGRIGFVHDLLREAVYADLADHNRRLLHRACAEYLGTVAGDPLTVAVHLKAAIAPGDEHLANMLAEAADMATPMLPDAAADWMLTAFHSIRPEQTSWRSLGLRCLELLGLVQRCDDALSVSEALLARTDDADGIGQIEIAAARTLWLANQWPAAVRRSARALRQPGLSEPMRIRLSALHALARARVEAAKAVEPAAQQALRAATGLGDRQAVTLAHHALAETSRNRADLAGSLGHYRELRAILGPAYIGQEIQGLQHLDRFGDAACLMREARAELGMDKGIVFMSLIYCQVWQDYHLGRLDDAETGARTQLTESLERGSRSCGLDAASLLALIALQRGDLAAARQRLGDGFGLASGEEELGNPIRLLVRGWVTAAEGAHQQALDLLIPLVGEGRTERDSWPWRAGWLRMLAQVGMAAGDGAFTDEVITLAGIGADRNPEVPSLTGTARQLRGLVGHDLALLDDAVTVLAASPRPLLRAGAHEDLGWELVRRGQRHDAGAHLDAAWTTYRDVGAAGPMHALQQQMKREGFRRRHFLPAPAEPSSGWAALTPAETAVARLIADGYTNKAASKELGISINTVGTHLRAIFRKLGVQSRVQLSNVVRERAAS
jgi:DNA-binding CsgD family transcriptional regulator